MSSVRTVGSVICAGVASSLVVAVLYAVLVWLRLPAQPWLGLRSFVSFALPLVLLQSVAAGCSWVRRSRASGWGERDDPLDAACAAGWCGIVLAATCLPATQVHLATVESLGVRGGWAVAFLALPVTLTRRAALLPPRATRRGEGLWLLGAVTVAGVATELGLSCTRAVASASGFDLGDVGRWSPLTASVPGVSFLSGTLLWLLVFGGLRLRRWQRAREITLGVWGGDLPLIPHDRRGVGGL